MSRLPNVHVLPVDLMAAHEDTGTHCWCSPRVLMLCPACDEVEGEQGAPGCWQCGGEGRVVCPDPDGYDGPHGLIVVHDPEDA